MGKLFEYIKEALKSHRRTIKIMKDDGTIIKKEIPVYVKDILEAHPNHAIFEGKATRPLSHNGELRPRHLYFLTSPFIEMVDDGDGSDLIKGELEKGSTMKVKVRLTKAELASLLSVDGSKTMKDVIGPLIQQALISQSLQSWHSISPSWKPNLRTVPEELSPRVGSCIH